MHLRPTHPCPTHPCPTLPAAGSSLVELLCAAAVLAIMLGIAAPWLEQMVARQRLVSASNSLVTGLHYARHAAVASGRSASLCPSAGNGLCGSQADWSLGWRVSADGAPQHLQAHYNGTLPRQIRVSLGQGRQQVRFLPDGRSPGTNLTLQLCSQGRWQRQIIVSNAGRVRTTAIISTPCD